MGVVPVWRSLCDRLRISSLLAIGRLRCGDELHCPPAIPRLWGREYSEALIDSLHAGRWILRDADQLKALNQFLRLLCQ
jgi:hypothetical protein